MGRRVVREADETEHPITKEFVAADEPVEVVFHSLTHYGSHDANRRLDVPCEIVSRGETRECPALGRHWLEIFDGVAGRQIVGERRAGGGGYVERDVIIRVAPEACPVVIHAFASYSYESRDHNESGRRSYAVKVVSGARE
jgi:hypothetical protein